MKLECVVSEISVQTDGLTHRQTRSSQ